MKTIKIIPKGCKKRTNFYIGHLVGFLYSLQLQFIAPSVYHICWTLLCKKESLLVYRNLFNHFLQLRFWTKILMCKYIHMSKVDCEKESFVQKVVPQLQIIPCAKVVWYKSPYIIWYLQAKVSKNDVIFLTPLWIGMCFMSNVFF